MENGQFDQRKAESLSDLMRRVDGVWTGDDVVGTGVKGQGFGFSSLALASTACGIVRKYRDGGQPVHKVAVDTVVKSNL